MARISHIDCKQLYNDMKDVDNAIDAPERDFDTMFFRSVLRVTSPRFAAFVVLFLLGVEAPLPSSANELLRISSMGGTRIATHARDAGIFGNPASLVHVQSHNIAADIAVENLRWGQLPKHGTAQLVAEVDMDAYLSSYYSHVFGKWGVSVGYTGAFTNFAHLTLAATRAEYDRGTRWFTSETDLITDWTLHREKSWRLGVSHRIGEFAGGARLKWVTQNIQQGQTVSTLDLSARHKPSVDPQFPEQLIAAIVHELQVGDRIRDIVHEKQPAIERNTSRLELDIGVQSEIRFGVQDAKALQVGILFENLLRADFAEPLPLQLGIGIAYHPISAILLAADTWHAIGQRGINFAIGTEFRIPFGKPGVKAAIPQESAIALRLGIKRVGTPLRFTAGIGITHGTFSIEYALIHQIADKPILEANHIVAFTVHF